MKTEVNKIGRNGEEHTVSITAKVETGFLKVNYMQHLGHHNKEFKYEYLNKRDATAMILFNNDYTKFYLVKQFRPGAMGTLWEIPAGILEENLSPLENSLKEVEEETGYKREDIIDIVELGGGFVSPGYTTEYLHLCAGRITKNAVQGEKSCDENESILEEGFFNYEEALKIGAFDDMKTALAYFRFKALLEEKKDR